MKKSILLLFFVLVLFTLPILAHAKRASKTKAIRICGDVVIVSEKRIKFNVNEKKLMCGDKKRNAWKTIPRNQAKFHTKTFLQARGYHFPKFEERNGKLYVITGQPTYFKKFYPSGQTQVLKYGRYRTISKQTLTPKKLNHVEGWVRERHQARGYPCPEIKSKADSRTGIVDVHVKTGPFQNLNVIKSEPIPGLAEGVLRRYDAFKLGKPYNRDFLVLTSRRIEEDGIVQSAHFATKCTPQGADVSQLTIPGPPRLVTFGIGANTEGLILGRASWRSTRLGRLGSAVEASMQASYLEQLLTLSADWYFLNPPSRWFFQPTISVDHNDEEQYEDIDIKVRPAASVSWDDQYRGFKLSFGPQLTYNRTLEGGVDEFIRLVSLSGQLDFQNHYFEFYRNSPRTGYHLTVLTELNHKNILSDLTAQRMELEGEMLWNFRHFDPPLMVVGIRGGLYSTLTNQNSTNILRLPPDYRYFLGGSQNLRGFNREELPGDSIGGLSAAFAGFELRFGILPHRIQPFVFADVGFISNNRYLLQTPFYWSPGVGVRWESPLGAVRATAAHGFVEGGDPSKHDELSHFQFYLSFGEEF